MGPSWMEKEMESINKLANLYLYRDQPSQNQSNYWETLPGA